MDVVIFTDADESINRIVIGVESEALRPAVLDAVERLGVPADAIVVQETERPVALQSLEDQVRPTLGGVWINDTNGGCTLVFNFNFVANRSLLKNSQYIDAFGDIENA